ncbi:ABC transporter substrate-binding protein [Epidermidibacterium keratini]|uniref:ABC transporter substrate-binding protein n=1 Tax=Epidermidibacterium keratini TaxID=1891644 RepID=A0A7L4YQF3_9ACTN|nr:ABC transporter substrate-binding protein [Epidermidibacterium keratini]QHC01019.1 ABC transporter substrate-binding protein [Epidermidibacterium keratini]
MANCGVDVAVDTPPKAAVTVNQAATEIMLSLGLADDMAGTAYLDDEVSPALKADYDTVPVLAPEYPTQETLLEAEPDFVYASYSSAFDDSALGPRDDLADLTIDTYLSPVACPQKSQRLAQDFDAVYQEIIDIGAIFGVSERAQSLVDQLKSTVAQSMAADAGGGRTALLWDSGIQTPSVASGSGMGGYLLESAGLQNVFGEDTGDTYVSTSWEAIVDTDPDVIVLVDAEWDPATDKIAFLQSDPATAQLSAVKNNAFVTLPFVETTVGLRAVDGLAALEQQLAADG